MESLGLILQLGGFQSYDVFLVQAPHVFKCEARLTEIKCLLQCSLYKSLKLLCHSVCV